MDREDVRRNWRMCLAFSMLSSVFFGTSIMTTYYFNVAHLSASQVYLLQATMYLTNMVADVPFGFLADRIGPRKVTLLGSMFSLAQSTYFVFCRTFLDFLPALVGYGLFLAALSSTCNSMTTLSLKMLGSQQVEQRLYKRFLTLSNRWSNGGYILGVIGGSFMVWLGGLHLPYYVQPTVAVTSFLCALRMKEPGTKTNVQHANAQMVVKAARMMLIDRSDIRHLIMVATGFRIFTSLTFWILQPRMAQAGIPIWAYGIVYVLWASANVAFSKDGHNLDAKRQRTLWALLVMLPSLAAVWAGLTTGVVSLFTLVAGLSFITIFVERLLQSFLSEVLPEDAVMRNTELSIASTIPTLAFAIAAPAYGVLANSSISLALVVVGVFCFIFCGLCLLLFWRAVSR